MDHVQRFAARFAGYERAYGRYEIKRTNERGKAEGKAVTVTGTPSLQDWGGHLDGTAAGLGSIPLRADNTVVFAALDVDDYRLDLKEIEKRINGYPLILCRSKSGGAHLYVFFKTPALASVVVETLHKWAAQLGFGGCEVFPKQTERVNDRDIGNWINLPYFDAGKTMRYCIRDGAAITLAEFLDFADSEAITEGELDDIIKPTPQKDSIFVDGPPCLRQLEAIGGFPEGTRNEGMFNVGVYLRKRFPDNWKDQMLPYSAKMCHPSLSLAETTTLVKSVDKKDYGYRCKQSPINVYCNRRECLKQQYGVGETGHGISAEIGNITKYDGNPVLWGIELGGQRVLVETDVLYSQHSFNKLCMERINRCPTSMPPARWQRYLDDKIKDADIVPVPEDASPEGQFWVVLEQFCFGRVQARNKDELLVGKPWREGEKVHFRSTGLLRYLKQQGWEYKSVHHVWQLLREVGAEKYFTTIKGKGLNVWWISMKNAPVQEEPEDLLAEAPEVF